MQEDKIHKPAIIAGLTLLLALLLKQACGDATTKEPGSAYNISNGIFHEQQAELILAETARNRDEKIAHLQKAMEIQYDCQLNIRAEFKLATLLSQTPDMKNNKPVDTAQGLKLFQGILEKYDHRAFYGAGPLYEDANSPEFMMPRSAVLAASILIGERREIIRARTYLKQCMSDINWTCQRRREEWLNAPKPLPIPDSESLHPAEPGDANLRERIHDWNLRRTRAESGAVLSEFEMRIAEAAVRQYGLSFGPQHPTDVPKVMKEIIDAYPGTLMAKIAETHVDRAAALAATSAPSSHPAIVPPQSIPQATSRLSQGPQIDPLKVTTGNSTLLIYGCAAGLLVLVGSILAWTLKMRRR